MKDNLLWEINYKYPKIDLIKII